MCGHAQPRLGQPQRGDRVLRARGGGQVPAGVSHGRALESESSDSSRKIARAVSQTTNTLPPDPKRSQKERMSLVRKVTCESRARHRTGRGPHAAVGSVFRLTRPPRRKFLLHCHCRSLVRAGHQKGAKRASRWGSEAQWLD